MKFFIVLTKRRLAVISAFLIMTVVITGQIFSADSGRIDGSTDTARVSYLKSLKIETDPDAVVCKEIVIPDTFNDVYKKYNDLQLQAGFDLSEYKGRQATVYTYSLGFSSERVVNLIVCDGFIIGGDVSSVKLDGEMRALTQI